MKVSTGLKVFQACILLSFLALALYFPYWWFGVLPYAKDYKVSQQQIDLLLAGTELPDYYAEALPPIDDAELLAQKEAFTWCRFCHTLEEGGEHRVGPNLHRILGKPAAVVEGFTYSAAFLKARDDGLIWTPETMAGFIANPAAMVPHNRMRYPPMIGYETSAERERRMLEYLQRMTR